MLKHLSKLSFDHCHGGLLIDLLVNVFPWMCNANTKMPHKLMPKLKTGQGQNWMRYVIQFQLCMLRAKSMPQGMESDTAKKY